MGRVDLRRVVALIAFASILATAACSLLLDRSDSQCTTSADCLRFSRTAVCQGGACVEGARDGAAGDGANGDGGPIGEGGPDGLGPPGCSTKTPTNDVEFYNACTTASYMAFDNCARIGACDGGLDAALVDPPVAEAGASSPIDGGPTVGCYDAVDRPNVIFIQGSTNFTPFVQAMAPLVGQSGYTLVWQPTSSCAGAGASGFDVTPGKNQMKNPTSTSQSFASFYGPTGTATPCLLGNSPNAPSGNAEITDIGESDVFASSCNSTWIEGPAFPEVGHYLGPVQSMVFVVPPGSTQRVISAEAARMVFGMGGNAGVAQPWVDPAFMWIRSSTTGTNNILSRGIGVPPAKWWGVDKRTAPNMRDSIIDVDPGSAEKTIGTLSIDFADKAKDNLHILYFQAAGQLAGFLPDLTPFTRDKENVRDGHYPLWGPIHLYTKVTGGQPSAAAAAFIGRFSVPKPDQALLDATIDTGNVPTCAMKVTRTSEMGPLSPFSPSFQCGCYYEAKVNGGTSCQKCGGPADCPATRPRCNIGYCEAQ